MSRTRASRVTALLVGGLVVLAQFPAAQTVRAAEPAGDLSFAVDASEAQESFVAELIVVRSNGEVGAVSVDVSVSGGSATETDDFDGGSVTLFWEDGDSASQSVFLSLVDDGVAEGPETIELTLSNPTGGASIIPPATTTLTVTDSVPNSAPVLDPIGDQSVDEGEILDVPLSATDAEGDPIIFSLGDAPAFLLVLNNDDGTGTFRATPGFADAGTYSITVSASDETGTDEETFTLTVVAVPNRPPVALDVFTLTPQDVPVTFPLDASDPDGDPLTYSPTQPANGSVTCDLEVCTYTPDEGFFGADRFTYFVNDGSADSNVATVSVTVTENVAVEAFDDAFTVLSGMTTTLDVTINDLDWDRRGLTVTTASDPSHGDLSCTGATCDYTPDVGYLGPDAFTYTVEDINGDTDSASVSIRVVKCTSAVGACIDNGTIRLGVRPEGHLNVPGGSPSAEQRTTTVGLRYLATGNEAIAPGCECEGWGAADAITGATGYANESTDAGANNLTVESFTSTATTALSVVTVDGVLRVTHDYHPSAQTPNLYEVSVSVENISAEAVDLRYRRVMDWDIEPTAFQEFVTTNVGTSPSVIANTNDGFSSANPLEPTTVGGVVELRSGNFVDAGPADHGALFDFGFGMLAPGASRDFTIWYGAAADEAGAMLALARAHAQVYSLGQPSTEDGASLGTPNTFIFGFSGVGGDPENNDPSASDDALDPGTPEDTARLIAASELLANDTDLDGDTPVISAVAAGPDTHGAVALNADGAVTYTPAANYSGPATFTYTVSDGHGGTDAATVTLSVAPVNDAPVADAQSLSTPFETALELTLTASDADADALTFSVATEPSNGSVSCTAADCTYTPEAGFSGSDSFTFTASDGTATSAPATIGITVAAKPLATTPLAADDDFSGEDGLLEDTPAPLDLLGNDSDADGDTLTIVGTTSPAHGAVECASHPCTYTPDANYFGPDSFTYTISDGGGGTDTATVTLEIGPVNDAPTADDAGVSDVAQGSQRSITLTGHDIDSETLTFEILTPPTQGSLGPVSSVSCVPAGGGATCTAVVTFSADEDAVGTDGFTYRASDGSLDSDPATVSLGFAAPPDPRVGIVDTSVVEGTGPNSTAIVFSVTLSRATTHDVTVAYATSPGTASAASDYGTATGTATIPAGATGTTVTLQVVADALDEPNESFGVTLSGPVGATLDPARTSATGTIADDDAAPSISIADVTANEGNSGTTSFAFTVTLSAPSGRDVTATASTADGSATAPADYVALSGVPIGIPAGQTSASVEVGVVADTAPEPNETFNVTLGGVVNATAGDASGLGTITNDDVAAGPTLSIADASQDEGNAPGSLVFTVTLSSPATASVTVAFATANGTATTPVDYSAGSGTVTFAAGQTTLTMAVPIVGDLLAEPDETFTVQLSAPAGATVADGLATGTIVNDDDCTVVGTNGPDNLLGTAGADVICALAGDDTVNGLGGGDVLRGGDGTDLVTFFNAPSGVVVDLAAGTATGWGADALSSFENLIGSEHADRLSGDDGANLISGLGGADEIAGGAGADTLMGLDGSDALDGGAGADEVFGNDGDDALIGGSDDDELMGGNGSDTADFRGAPGGVTVDLARNRATGWGSDRLSLIENAIGSLFADTLLGNAGPNVLSGSGGNDSLVGDAGDDELRGGDGTDTADFQESRGPITVNLRARSATGDGDDFVENVENVIGTDRDDTLVGDDGANVLSGLKGDDTLTGWFGNDDLRGGTGVDTVLYNAIVAGAGPMTVNLDSGAAAGAWGGDSLSLIEDVFGTSFADTIIGTDGVNVLHGGPGADTVNGLAGNDTLFGGDGDDTLLGGDGQDTMNGNEGSDEIFGQGASDEISGQDGNDTLSGGAGNDSLSGGNGQDSILGNEGNDTLVGGPGGLPDTLNGGVGHDSCFDSEGAQDVKISCEKT